MGRGIFVTGTDTGVGKTVVSAVIVECLKQSGLDVGVMKPFETGCSGDKGHLVPPDGIFLRDVAGADDTLDDIVPYCFALPLAPAVAADIEGRQIDLSLVWSAFSRLLGRHDMLVVEGAGGLFVPITRIPLREDPTGMRLPGRVRPYFVSDIIREMALPAVIVTRPTLGTINHTLLTVRQARQEGLRLLGLIINHAQPPAGSPAELTNRGVLEELAECPCLAEIPFIGRLSAEGIRDTARSAAPNLASSLLQALS